LTKDILKTLNLEDGDYVNGVQLRRALTALMLLPIHPEDNANLVYKVYEAHTKVFIIIFSFILLCSVSIFSILKLLCYVMLNSC
jgi:uncharacterized membrane protein YdjX (TVP38/TMEM64 family)